MITKKVSKKNCNLSASHCIPSNQCFAIATVIGACDPLWHDVSLICCRADTYVGFCLFGNNENEVVNGIPSSLVRVTKI